MRKVLLLAGLVGCTKAADRAPPGPTPTPPPGPTNPQPPTPPTPPPAEPPELTHPPVPPAMRDYGGCRVSIRGPATIEQLAGGGPGAVVLSYWDREGDNPLFDGKQGMMLHCDGPQANLMFTIMHQTDAVFPYAPKRYVIGPGPKDVLDLVGTLNDADRTMFQNADGTFEITAIDAKHVAGKFDLKANYVTRSGAHGEATLKGSFDFKCPGDCK